MNGREVASANDENGANASKDNDLRDLCEARDGILVQPGQPFAEKVGSSAQDQADRERTAQFPSSHWNPWTSSGNPDHTRTQLSTK
jgi:hypothetical protein